MQTNEQTDVITATLIPEQQRLGTLPRYFGAKLTRAEMLVYDWMGALSKDYSGGYWNFYALSNGGFYMAPAARERMTISVEGNGFSGEMSADAAGIVAVLFAFCQIANETEEDRFIELYHQVRDYAAQFHPERRRILRAID
jgi:hypothetical protein